LRWRHNSSTNKICTVRSLKASKISDNVCYYNGKRAKTLIIDVIAELDKIPHDVSLPVHHAPTGSVASTWSTPHPAVRMTEQEEHNVSASAPPAFTTKGNHKTCVGITASIPQPHFQRDRRTKIRKCGRCGLYDTWHNVATCERVHQQLKNGVIK
jgi:hypothetical protein